MFPTLLIALFVAAAFAQNAPQPAGLLHRQYREGEKLTYRMTATNESWKYSILANAVVKKDEGGKFFEEYSWSDLVSNGKATPLPEASLQFRQPLSLDPLKPPSVPNLAKVSPSMIGPITDMLTFYADLWLANRLDQLSKAGDHVYHKHGTPASWADGNVVVLGEDSIDFDFTLKAVDTASKVATLLVRHVPPAQPAIKLPTPWMREPVADTPNNWVDVKKRNGKHLAAVGQETFDVEMKISLVDGKILSGSMRNPVKTRVRDCSDGGLTDCGEPRPHSILREISISLEQ